MTTMKMLVLGCGPAGLLAAHAGVVSDAKVSIVSIKKPSVIGGAQYLHEEIPDLYLEAFDLLYMKIGTKENYAMRVYGDRNAPCSWDNYQGMVRAYSMRGIYRQLWDRYEHLIEDREVEWKEPVETDYDLVVSSIPLINHSPYIQWAEWRSQKIWIVNGQDKSPLFSTISYNGTSPDNKEYVEPYRISNILGVEQSEYSTPVEGGFSVTKPISTNWTPPPNLGVDLHVGRYGKWNKNVLAHEAFFETLRKIHEMH